MAEVIRMPKMSDTMEEGVIASWLKSVGDTVQSGDILAEVETDKATMELENYEDGVLLHIGIQAGESVPVDGVIAIIGEAGENFDDLLSQATQEANGGGAAPTASTSEAPAAEPAQTAAIDVSGIEAEVIRMPKMSDTMEEGTIAAWHKQVGDEVQSGDILAEVETDKATMELESYNDGTLLYIGIEAGNAVPVDGVIAVIGEKDANYQALLQASEAGAAAAPAAEAPAAPAAEAPAKSTSASSGSEAPAEAPIQQSAGNGRVKASPLAKKIAKDLGYNLSEIKGSGDGGRIVKRDVEQFTPAAAAPAPAEKAAPAKEAAPAITLPSVVGEEQYEEVKVSQMRKTIARRLSESKFSAPHFYLTMEINMDKAIEARKSMNEVSPVKISFNDLVIKATAAALRQHPGVNASWLGDTIRYNKHVHIGVAVAVDEGLLVPVVRFADNKSLSHIAAEVKDLAKKAQGKKLQPSDWEGNTFTISNLGMFGIEEFTAIINSPDACIMAVGGIKQTPIVKDGQIVPGNVMKVTLSCDHRVVDGAIGAAFLQTFKQLLEDPIRIMI